MSFGMAYLESIVAGVGTQSSGGSHLRVFATDSFMFWPSVEIPAARKWASYLQSQFDDEYKVLSKFIWGATKYGPRHKLKVRTH